MALKYRAGTLLWWVDRLVVWGLLCGLVAGLCYGFDTMMDADAARLCSDDSQRASVAVCRQAGMAPTTIPKLSGTLTRSEP